MALCLSDGVFLPSFFRSAVLYACFVEYARTRDGLSLWVLSTSKLYVRRGGAFSLSPLVLPLVEGIFSSGFRVSVGYMYSLVA
jgi:hypothetical protein